ncbi:MAG TPA: hypothetical protein VH560_06770 [Polyangia bacterium]|jgi:hypothetical protein|nr:hypothetical protein [Polyangia bacterium]
MLYVSLGTFVLATILIGLDVAGLRFAHGAGLMANGLLLVCMAFVAAKAASLYRHHHGT